MVETHNEGKRVIQSEIEIKILGIDKSALIATLLHRGAIIKFDGIILDRYFDGPSDIIRKNKRLLRLRQKIPEIGMPEFVVTYKGKKHLTETSKKRIEYEFRFDDYHSAREEVDRLFSRFSRLLSRFSKGKLKEVYLIEKSRTSLKIDEISFDFDEYQMDREEGDQHNLSEMDAVLEIEFFDYKKLGDVHKLIEDLGLEINEAESKTSSRKLIAEYLSRSK